MRISDWSSDVCSSDLVLRHPLRDDRQEDDVVDAENDLEEGEGQQAGPDVGIGDPVEHRFSLRRRDVAVVMWRGWKQGWRRDNGSGGQRRAEEHTSAIQSHMRITYTIMRSKTKITRLQD